MMEMNPILNPYDVWANSGIAKYHKVENPITVKIMIFLPFLLLGAEIKIILLPLKTTLGPLACINLNSQYKFRYGSKVRPPCSTPNATTTGHDKG